MRRRKALKKQLLADGTTRIKKKIAVLGGSTTDDVVTALELFLLNFGIEPQFYQSEYNKFYEDAVFGSSDFVEFKPDLISTQQAATSRLSPMMRQNLPTAFRNALTISSVSSNRRG